MTRAQAWLFITSGLAGLLAVSIASGKEHWPKRALMKGAVGVCVAASAIALAPCANADDDSFLANLSQHGIFTLKNPQGLVAAVCGHQNGGVALCLPLTGLPQFSAVWREICAACCVHTRTAATLSSGCT